MSNALTASLVEKSKLSGQPVGTIVDGHLVVCVPGQAPHLSQSGKSMLTHQANIKLPGVEIDGKLVTVMVNAYISAK